MADLNMIIQLMSLLKQGNPRAVAEQIIKQNYPNDPNMNNLLQLGEKGDVKSLEQIARQMLGQQGKDFNTEMNNLINMTKQF